MSTPGPRPPRLAHALLERLIPAEQRPFLMGDLQEGFARRCASASRGAAVRWYWRQVLAAARVRRQWPQGTTDAPVARVSAGDRAADLLRDLRLAYRGLIRRPGLTALSILALGLGVGATATSFSILWGTVLRGLPFEEADRLVHFERANVADDVLAMAVTPHDYVTWRAQQRTFEDLGAYVEGVIQIPGTQGPPERHYGVFIDAQSFRLLRVGPALGRVFTEDEDQPGAADVILLSHGLWTQRFGADPDLVGRTIPFNGRSATVVGIMPEGFGFPVAESFWLPLRLDLRSHERGSGRLDVFGRLRPGVELREARTEFAAIASRIALEHPDTNGGVTTTLRSFTEEYVGPEFTRVVTRMLVGAVLVLLVACANVASLLLVRAADRRQELAVRTALGARKATLARQLLTESGLLAVAGALWGLGLAAVGVGWFRTAGAQAGVFQLPHGSASLFWWDVQVDAAVLAFVLAVTVLVTLVSGLAPALHGADTDVAGTLREQGRRTGRSVGRFTRALVVTEIALTTGLLVASGLVIRSVVNTGSVGDAFDSDGVLTTRVSLPLAALGLPEASFPDHEARLRFVEGLVATLGTAPGISAVAAATVLPSQRPLLLGFSQQGGIYATPGDQPETWIATVSHDYFRLFGVAAVEGRTLAARDGDGGEPVTVVSRSFAQRFFQGESAVDRRIRLGGPDSSDPWVRIVGVVPDLWIDASRPGQETVYVPLSQSRTPDPAVRLSWRGLRNVSLAVRGAGDPEGTARAIREAVYAASPDVPVSPVIPMTDLVALQTGRYHVWGRYYLVFGAVALFMATLGLYGVMSHAVAGRTAEIGVRRALGASGALVLRGVVADGLRQIGLGAGLGILVALWMAGGMNRILFRVNPWDPWVLVSVLAVLLATGVAATLVPAGRAASVDPASALRSD